MSRRHVLPRTAHRSWNNAVITDGITVHILVGQRRQLGTSRVSRAQS